MLIYAKIIEKKFNLFFNFVNFMIIYVQKVIYGRTDNPKL